MSIGPLDTIPPSVNPLLTSLLLYTLRDEEFWSLEGETRWSGRVAPGNMIFCRRYNPERPTSFVGMMCKSNGTQFLHGGAAFRSLKPLKPRVLLSNTSPSRLEPPTYLDITFSS
ncbi:hypothetical protein C8R45DRAFT_1115735 [Mycena sanguinolenta]|nr:hypothetical protein C8R45DRAFT_1115735 [Mycena sanguinolenta]